MMDSIPGLLIQPTSATDSADTIGTTGIIDAKNLAGGQQSPSSYTDAIKPLPTAE